MCSPEIQQHLFFPVNPKWSTPFSMALREGLLFISLRDCKGFSGGVGSKPRLCKVQNLTTSCALDQNVKSARCRHSIQPFSFRGNKWHKSPKVSSPLRLQSHSQDKIKAKQKSESLKSAKYIRETNIYQWPKNSYLISEKYLFDLNSPFFRCGCYLFLSRQGSFWTEKLKTHPGKHTKNV